MDRAEVRPAIDDNTIAVLRRHRLDRLGHVLDQRRQREQFEVKLHSPRLDLGEVQNVVDQREQVPARAEYPIERLDVLLQRLGVLPQHLGDADDRVERRAQLVAHAGEELRLVLTGDFELLAFLADFREQARVLDRQNRLGGKGLEQFHRACGKLSRGLTAHEQRPHHLAGPYERYQQPRPVARAQDGVIDRRRWQFAQIGRLVGLMRFGQLADSVGNSGVHVADRRD